MELGQRFGGLRHVGVHELLKALSAMA